MGDPSESPTEQPTPMPSESPTELTETTTPAPTHHSAAKWEMLHPDHGGGDGELLWNIYYGDFSDDERFDSFRKDQLWDSEVIRPILEKDVKYARFQLNHQVLNAPEVRKTAKSNYQWMVLVCAAVIILAAAGLWYRQKKDTSKVFNSSESQSLIADRKEQYVY